MSLVVALKCEACGRRMGTMQIRAVDGGLVSRIKAYIQPRVTFYCAPCSKVNR